MISKLNQLLLPIENYLKKYRKYIGYFLILLAFVSLWYLSDTDSIKESGEKAILVLWIILWIPIFARVFSLGIARQLLPLRKELGILMGFLAFVHGSRFIMNDPTYILTKDFWIYDGQINFLAFGSLALMLTIPLTLTSNTFSMKKMGKYWKYLHKVVYIIAIFTVIHVVLLKWSIHFEFAPVAILIAYFIGKTLEWKNISFWKKAQPTQSQKWQKYYCIPCGYIYDPALWDEDGGIPPGTEFADIPDSWRCPDCGVTKADFVPYDGEENIEKETATIYAKNFLNETTLELVIETEKVLTSLPGQFLSFFWLDTLGEFRRQYSIVSHEGKCLTFTIKLAEKWRGATLLREIPVGTRIAIGKPAGSFLLQDTAHPKIYIATGTGLAPIYRMLLALPSGVSKSLYFSVATEKELFYIDRLRSIPDLDLHVHVTREKVEWYHEGRVNIDEIEATPDTEWYLCGNPKMVSDAKEKLTSLGYTRVFAEEFS